uniref:Uncharacterized protein n=1 Tax=Bionectria ochroleuca TaxID=29856 RepID=A0A8H7K520_BIOOC
MYNAFSEQRGQSWGLVGRLVGSALASYRGTYSIHTHTNFMTAALIPNSIERAWRRGHIPKRELISYAEGHKEAMEPRHRALTCERELASAILHFTFKTHGHNESHTTISSSNGIRARMPARSSPSAVTIHPERDELAPVRQPPSLSCS